MGTQQSSLTWVPGITWSTWYTVCYESPISTTNNHEHQEVSRCSTYVLGPSRWAVRNVPLVSQNEKITHTETGPKSDEQQQTHRASLTFNQRMRATSSSVGAKKATGRDEG